MLNVFSYPYQLDESISVFRLLDCSFHFYSNLIENALKQTLETLIRRRVLRRLIWSDLVLHFLLISNKKDPSLYGLIFAASCFCLENKKRILHECSCFIELIKRVEEKR